MNDHMIICLIYYAGEPTLTGISGVDGTGHLGMDLSGSAEWLMVPYSHAAPQDDTQFDVGGRLSYSVGGSNFSVPLLPDTITVKPNPSLIVHYFHEKYVRGDDPLTQKVEPIIPFTLAVMVMNAGYGVARALKISSAQPEIIENEKGLLVTFKIIGSQIGRDPITPSLTVTFGDIESFETKTARWLLTSTLKGTFYNFSATFENVNPLGDPQLSLLDELGYHELVHGVRIEDGIGGISSEDDGLDDFLVNDLVDENVIPDRLYNSANGSDVQHVLTTEVTQFKLLNRIVKSSKKYAVVQLTVTANASSWSYTRVINNLTSPNPADNEYLLMVKREDGKTILVVNNAWQTTHIKDMFLFHLLDYIPRNINDSVEMAYNLSFGPRNIYPPKFNSTRYSGSVSMNAPFGTVVLKLEAYDIDGDLFHFRLVNTDTRSFTVNDTGEIMVFNSLSVFETVELEAIVEDTGIPSRSSSVVVTIRVIEEGSTLSTMAPGSSTSAASSMLSTTSGGFVTHTTVPDSNITSTSISASTSSSPLSTTSATRSTSESDTTETSSHGADMTTAASTTQSTSSQNVYSTQSTRTTMAQSTGVSVTESTGTVKTQTTESTSTSSSEKTSTQSTVNITVHSAETTPLTTPGNGTFGEQGDTPRWVIPTAIGAVVLVLLIVFTAALIYAIRRTNANKPPAVRSNSYTFNQRR